MKKSSPCFSYISSSYYSLNGVNSSYFIVIIFSLYLFWYFGCKYTPSGNSSCKSPNLYPLYGVIHCGSISILEGNISVYVTHSICSMCLNVYLPSLKYLFLSEGFVLISMITSLGFPKINLLKFTFRSHY